MSDSNIAMNPNPLVQFIKKQAVDFTRDDLVAFCQEYAIEMVNFRYVAEDGRLKTLNFPITSKAYLEEILSHGERVDGSSLFSFIEAGSSDLYVLPRYRTAFLNPFEEVPALDIFCSFYNNEGKPLDSDPGQILRKANDLFQQETGLGFLALGELEYYVIAPADNAYPGLDQKGYHASEPFAKYEFLRKEALLMLARAGGLIKYGHSEVGCFADGDTYYEQHEIEFLPTPPEQAAEQMILAKWFLRMLGYKYGVDISFAPKITVGKAGSGMHFHMMVTRDGQNITASNGSISDTARKMIAGILDAADALTAFGNTIPTSYLRLVPHQEAPTNICWGDRNRSVVIRVPLGWTGAGQMLYDCNPNEPSNGIKAPSKQTFEYRVSDGSANIFLLLAGLIVSALDGIRRPDALELARNLYVDGNIFKPEYKERLATLHQLPISCVSSAETLDRKRYVFENDSVFPKGLLDSHILKLRSYQDHGLSERLFGKSEEIKNLVDQHIHVG